MLFFCACFTHMQPWKILEILFQMSNNDAHSSALSQENITITITTQRTVNTPVPLQSLLLSTLMRLYKQQGHCVLLS